VGDFELRRRHMTALGAARSRATAGRRIGDEKRLLEKQLAQNAAGFYERRNSGRIVAKPE
jgi:hypothetical protein